MIGPGQNLNALGLPEADPCLTCNGLGYVRDDVPFGHPLFGKLQLCPSCGEATLQARVVAQLAAKRDRLSLYESRDCKQTFETFVPGRNPQVVLAYHLAKEFSKDLTTGWLLLSGTKGVGKTHLMMAILNAQPEHISTLFQTVPDLLDMLRSGYQHKDYDELLSLCRSVRLLALDDLGVEKQSDWAIEKLFQIINHRYQAKLSTVFSTNVPILQLEPRISSRLRDDDLVTSCNLYAPDYRSRRSTPGRVSE